MIYTCKYCGHECITYILSEKAHVCHRCGTLRASGIELDTDLFWNQKADEEYFKKLSEPIEDKYYFDAISGEI